MQLEIHLHFQRSATSSMGSVLHASAIHGPPSCWTSSSVRIELGRSGGTWVQSHRSANRRISSTLHGSPRLPLSAFQSNRSAFLSMKSAVQGNLVSLLTMFHRTLSARSKIACASGVHGCPGKQYPAVACSLMSPQCGNPAAKISGSRNTPCTRERFSHDQRDGTYLRTSAID